MLQTGINATSAGSSKIKKVWQVYLKCTRSERGCPASLLAHGSLLGSLFADIEEGTNTKIEYIKWR